MGYKLHVLFGQVLTAGCCGVYAEWVGNYGCGRSRRYSSWHCDYCCMAAKGHSISNWILLHNAQSTLTSPKSTTASNPTYSNSSSCYCCLALELHLLVVCLRLCFISSTLDAGVVTWCWLGYFASLEQSCLWVVKQLLVVRRRGRLTPSKPTSWPFLLRDCLLH